MLIFSAQIATAGNSENQGDGECQVEEETALYNKEQNQTMEQLGVNFMDPWRYKYRNKIHEGIENKTIVKECNISKKTGKMYINSNEYQNGMTVEVKEQSQHKLQIKVSAEFKEGKILVLNYEVFLN